MIRTKRDKKHIYLLVLLLLLGIGFAALTATLKINGTINIDSAKWDVHFENVEVAQGSVTATTVPTSDDATTTEMTYAVDFTKPGDFYEFTVDMANDGTIDAMVNLVTNKVYAADGETEKQLPAYLKSTVTYDDGVEIKPNQLLAKQTSEKIKVRVEFKTDVNPEDLPSSAETTVFKFSSTFKQADENATPVRKQYTPGDLVYFDPVTQANCNESTFDLNAVKNGTSTCYKWRVITVGDTLSNNNITIQLDHNLINSTWTTENVSYDGPKTLVSALATETTNWTIPTLTYNYSYAYNGRPWRTLECINGVCKIEETDTQIATNVKARVITAEEVRELVMYAGAAENSIAGNWKQNDTHDKFIISHSECELGNDFDYCGNNYNNKSTALSWLLENTNSSTYSGATSNIYGNSNSYGYWTLTSYYGTSNHSIVVAPEGTMYHYDIRNNIGVRPVIVISKSNI